MSSYANGRAQWCPRGLIVYDKSLPDITLSENHAGQFRRPLQRKLARNLFYT